MHVHFICFKVLPKADSAKSLKKCVENATEESKHTLWRVCGALSFEGKNDFSYTAVLSRACVGVSSNNLK